MFSFKALICFRNITKFSFKIFWRWFNFLSCLLQFLFTTFWRSFNFYRAYCTVIINNEFYIGTKIYSLRSWKSLNWNSIEIHCNAVHIFCHQLYVYLNILSNGEYLWFCCVLLRLNVHSMLYAMENYGCVLVWLDCDHQNVLTFVMAFNPFIQYHHLE